MNANGDILGFNMYAYCGNNPVMGYDPTGEVNWKNIFKAGAVVLLMTAAVTVGVAAGGTVFAVLGLMSQSTLIATTIGTAVGGVISGTMEIVAQCVKYGSDNIDYVDVAIETGTGSLLGVTTGFSSTIANTGLQVASKVTNVLISASGAFAHSVNNSLTKDEIIGNTVLSVMGSSALQTIFFRYGLIRNNFGKGFGGKAAGIFAAGRVGANAWRYKSVIFDIVFD